MLLQSGNQPNKRAARCHAFEKEWIECAHGIGQTRAKKECQLEFEDFYECMHREKTVSVCIMTSVCSQRLLKKWLILEYCQVIAQETAEAVLTFVMLDVVYFLHEGTELTHHYLPPECKQESVCQQAIKVRAVSTTGTTVLSSAVFLIM